MKAYVTLADGSTAAWSNVCVWHVSDIQECPQFGRFRGASGHGTKRPRSTRMTQSEHWAFGLFQNSGLHRYDAHFISVEHAAS